MDEVKEFDRESYRRRSRAFFKEWFAQAYAQAYPFENGMPRTYTSQEIEMMAAACFYAGAGHATDEVLSMIREISGEER